VWDRSFNANHGNGYPCDIFKEHLSLKNILKNKINKNGWRSMNATIYNSTIIKHSDLAFTDPSILSIPLCIPIKNLNY
jgi:hypothetical protein